VAAADAGASLGARRRDDQSTTRTRFADTSSPTLGDLELRALEARPELRDNYIATRSGGRAGAEDDREPPANPLDDVRARTTPAANNLRERALSVACEWL
jgi:hypothetical protein